MSETTDLIKRLRARGLTQSEIARRTDIPQSRLSRWEGGVAPVGADDALKLAALERDLDQGDDSLPGQAAAGPPRAGVCTCGSWEMAEDDQAVVPLAPTVADAPQPSEPEALPLAAAFALGGRREDDHAGSDFGVLDVNGDTLAAEIEARARLTGDLPVRPDEEGGDAI